MTVPPTGHEPVSNLVGIPRGAHFLSDVVEDMWDPGRRNIQYMAVHTFQTVTSCGDLPEVLFVYIICNFRIAAAADDDLRRNARR